MIWRKDLKSPVKKTGDRFNKTYELLQETDELFKETG